jgi:muramoyltetrapeptide carboxypeptidase LdcA involved in peptidoglycan recycling
MTTARPRLKLKRPRALAAGSRVALVTPSWGGPATFPAQYEKGARELRERFGFEVTEMPHTRSDVEWLWRNPRARAEDLNAAFADPTVDGIIATIGGDDSVRILPYLDRAVIAANPKVFMGFSDITTLHTFALINGLQTFYGPSVMAGIAETGGTLKFTEEWIRRTIMSDSPVGKLNASPIWTEERIPWEEIEQIDRPRVTEPNAGWHWLQGNTRAEGHLIGGCIDVLEFLKGTAWWPEPSLWEGAVFYWETSEDAPSLSMVSWWLRNYGMIGILDKLSGMLVGRPRGYTPEQRAELPHVIQRIVADEFGRPDLPIVTNLDFGHTDPQLALPNGANIIIDPTAQTITLPDPATEKH